MPQPTKQERITALETASKQLAHDLQESRKHAAWQTGELNRLRDQVKALDADKRWLQSIISPLAQAIHTRS